MSELQTKLLENGFNVICEKPIVLNPWNLDALEEIEKETGNITLRGATWMIWSDARHKAYKTAHDQSNINNPIRHPALDVAIKESNELQTVNEMPIIKYLSGFL